MHIYSVDKSQCITVIDDWDTRYIINGKFYDVPENNYIKLDVGDVDPLEDGIYICWSKQNYEWQLISDGAQIVDINLDTNRFLFGTELPKERGIPSDKEFRGDHCAIFDYYQMKLFPNSEAIVEFVD